MGIILIVLITIFLKSNAINLIIPPKKSKKKITSSSVFNATKKQTNNTLINKICNQYGNIQFIFHDNQFVYDESGNFSGVEDFIMTSVTVPNSIKGIAGLDENFTYIDRMKATDALGENLTNPEQKALLHFLHKRRSEDKLTSLRFNSVKNQVCIALMRQIPANQEFPLHMIAMYHEKDEYGITWRDYTIQFLGQCYSQIDTAENKKAVKDTLYKALEEKQNIAAPAIIALDGLSKNSGFSKSKIADAAYKLVSDNQTANIVKIPALQIAAKYNHPKALKLARKILTGSKNSQSKILNSPPSSSFLNSPSVILKMSAIATIGAHGENEDIQLLQQFRKSADIRLRVAAKAALRKLM